MLLLRFPRLLAGFFDDLHSFDLVNVTWKLLSPAAGSAQPPSARGGHGFTSAGGKLYVHGGYGYEGVCGDVWWWKWKGRRAKVSESTPGTV